MTESAREVDVVVVGGGINGTGVARDLSLRGVKVALFERGDLGAAATGASSGMIHGGMRYLVSDRETTRRSCEDSGYIQRIAPHLIFRIPFLLPLFRGRPFSAIRHEAFEAFFRAYDAFAPLKGGKPHTRLSREEALQAEPGLRTDVVGALTMDEWGIDPVRLVIANAVDARERGATVETYAPVVSLLREPGGAVSGVRVRERESGRVREVRAQVVVNCAGPWVPGVSAMAGAEVKLRPSKGVHVTLERRISNLAVIAEAIDGRSVFVQPHENVTIIGTTDDDYYGDPGDIPIQHDEVEYLLEAAERVIPTIRDHRILRAWAGIRPTLFADGRYEDDLSRRHEVVDHARRDRVEGLVTLTGGKLAAYRLMAEEASDLVMAKLGRLRLEPGTLAGGSDAGAADFQPGRRGGSSHRAALPGGDGKADPREIAGRCGIDLFAALRLAYRHGTRAERVLDEGLRGAPHGRRVVCASEPVLEAEIRHCCRNEWVTCLEDLRRRTKLGEGPCQGLECAAPAARILGEELGWDGARVAAETLRFLEARFRERRPTLRGRNLAHEELLQGAFLGVEGMGGAIPPGGAIS